MLISAHARGEYLLYQLLTNDAVLLSDFRFFFEYFKDPKDSTDSWYKGQVNCMMEYYDCIDKILQSEGTTRIPLNQQENTVMRKNYYDSKGSLLYYDSYTYYDNGRLCSSTLYSSNNWAKYTLLYLYDESGKSYDTIFGSFFDSGEYNEDTGEFIMNCDEEYSKSISIYPQKETIEQTRFGVDPSKSEKIYGVVPIISTVGSNEWASVYLNTIDEDKNFINGANCGMININSDSIPEIWVDYGMGHSCDKIYTQGNNNVNSITVGHASCIEWIEKENLLNINEIHDGDVISDNIYKIEDGEFIPIAYGEYGVVYRDREEFSGNNYYWDEIQVTEDEYEEKRNNIFAQEKAVNIYPNIYTYEQCERLLQWLISAKSSFSQKE